MFKLLNAADASTISSTRSPMFDPYCREKGQLHRARVVQSKVKKVYARLVEYEVEFSGSTREMDFVLLEDGSEYCRAQEYQQLRPSVVLDVSSFTEQRDSS